MENKIHLQITTAGGTVCDEMANYVAVPLTDGEAGILANHANMIGALNEGVVRYKIDDEMHFVAVSGGVMSVADNELIILARSAESRDHRPCPGSGVRSQSEGTHCGESRQS